MVGYKYPTWSLSLVGRENVVAGTDCGLGGRVHPGVAWGKFRAMVEGVHLASTSLWSI